VGHNIVLPFVQCYSTGGPRRECKCSATFWTRTRFHALHNSSQSGLIHRVILFSQVLIFDLPVLSLNCFLFVGTSAVTCNFFLIRRLKVHSCICFFLYIYSLSDRLSDNLVIH
jgi:hypothetical protein